MVAKLIGSLTLWVLAGAVAGLLAGLLLTATGVAGNPFWAVAVGIVVAAVCWPFRTLRTGSPARR